MFLRLLAPFSAYEQVPEQPPQSALGISIPDDMAKPIAVKSTLIGFAFSKKSLSITKVNPFALKTSSVSFDSSRARASEGPAQPPWLRNTRTGTTFGWFSKYSASFFWAASVHSNIKILL